MRHVLFSSPHARRVVLAAAATVIGSFGLAGVASAEFVSSVQSFNQGTVNFANAASQYNTPAAALGEPSRIAFSPVSPFNPPFEESQLVAVGVGGSIVLELSSPVPVGGASTVHVGVFTGAGLNDPSFGGQAESPARTFAGAEYAADRTAVIEVASVLGDFKPLGRMTLANPTQAFANQSTPYDFPTPPLNSDFDKPFTGDLSSFNGLNAPQISALLAGSAGGNWIDVPAGVASQLSEIRYVRISDPMWRVIADGSLVMQRQSNSDPLGNGQPFFKNADVFLDGVNVVVPEPAGVAVLAMGTLALVRRRRVKSRRVRSA
jgi:hypothetical protein